MAIAVHLPGILAPHAGGARTLAVEGATVGEVLGVISTRHPQLGARLKDSAGDPSPFVTIYLNDEDVRFLGGLGARVAAGDEVTIVPAIAGG